MKICKECLIEKGYDEFYTRVGSKDGYRNDCKECFLKKRKEYIITHSEENKIRRKGICSKYYLKNKNNILKRQKSWLEIDENKKKRYEYSKEYSKNNKDRLKEKRLKNKQIKNENERNRKNNDPLYKLTCNIRSSISMYLRINGYNKKSKTQEILGCSFEFFKSYIESKFESWMNWDNRGLYNGELNYGWDIDHITPMSSATSEEEIIKLNHYTNLQPLCSKVNRDIKKDKLYQ